MDRAKAKAFIRMNAGSTGIEVLVNVVLPFTVYSLTKQKLGDVDALLASMVPPLVWSAVEFVHRRRIDVLSMFIVAGILLSLLAFFGGGSVKFLQLRENLVTAVIGLVFLGSAAIGKPLIYELARASSRRRSAAEAESLERHKDNKYFRATMMLMTVVWGVGFILETIVACILVFVMPIQAYLVVSPIVGYGSMGLLALWTLWYGERQKRIGAARRAAGERSAAGDG